MISLIRGLNRRGIRPDLLWDIHFCDDIIGQEHLDLGYRKLGFGVPSERLEHTPDTLSYLLRVFNSVQGNSLYGEYDFFYIFYNGFFLSKHVPHLRYLSGPPLLPQLVRYSPGLRGMPFRSARLLYRVMLRRFSPIYDYHADNHYVINSQYTADLFEAAHGVRLPVIYPPIDLSSRSFTGDDLPQRDTITFFSRVADAKRPERVIELAARHPRLRCVIMGSVPPHRAAYFETLKVLARELGRPDIVFLATPTNAQVREELARTRYYVFPAHDEHFGMTTPEAIGSGAIPFVHDSGGQREIVPDERLRFTDDTFFSQFEKLLALTETELNQMRMRLRQHVDLYSEDAFIQHMLAKMDNLPANETAQGSPLTAAANGEPTS
jgi:hypothetical protein